MRFAPFADEITPFLTMEVMDRAIAMEAGGRDVLRLAFGEPDCAPPAAAVQAAERALRDGQTRYTESLGIEALREAIAEDCLCRRGVEVSPERILVTSGTSPALNMVMRLLLQPGDEVVVPTPHYPCYPNMIVACGATPVFVPTRAADGYAIDIDAVRSAMTANTRAIVVASPANPTGAVQPAQVMRSLSELGVPLLSDEVYDGLVFDDITVSSPLGMGGDCFVFDGFSKRYAMTGFRLGYVIAPAEAVRPLQKMQQNFHISAAHFVQAAGVAALRQGAGFVQEMRDAYAARRRIMVDGLRALGFDITRDPDGAFYVLADGKHLDGDSLRLCFTLLENAGVAIAPGRDFGQAAEGHLRFSYAADPAVIHEGLQRLRAVL